MKFPTTFFVLLTLIVFTSLTLVLDANNYNPDMIVCTYNRPLQLKAFLESFFKYASNYGKIMIIARIDKDFESAYEKLIHEFPQCTFIKQSQEDPKSDYKQLTIDAIFNTPSTYMLFAVDDIVVTDYIDFNTCIEALEKTDAYGFYLRLGKNIHHCLTLKMETSVPDLKPLGNDIYQWQFKNGRGDWLYPNSMDMTVLKKSDIKEHMLGLDYNTPNTLEAIWCRYAEVTKYGLCFEYSRVVNLQFNVVQDNWPYTIEKNIDIRVFLEKFNQNLKLDISVLHQMKNSAPHVEGYIPTYIASN